VISVFLSLAYPSLFVGQGSADFLFFDPAGLDSPVSAS
jgi:hypothetical protein